MANCNPPVKNQAFDLGFCLYKTDGSLIGNPGTITALVSKDFGDYTAIGTVTEEDSTYGQLKAALTATEMNADTVMVYIVDNTSGCVPFTATIYTCSATRGLAGTALPAVAADGAGGLPVSDLGGLDLDGLNTNVSSILTDTGTTLDGYITSIIDWIENKLVRTDNGDGTITYVQYADNGSTPARTWVYTTATGTRAKST